MRTIDINIRMVFCQPEELAAEDRQLVETAIEATNNAYAKYSHFHVGAALRLENGTIVKGANQENAAFPSSLCAERTAVFAAQANFPDQPIAAIAIAARNENGLVNEPVTPCGPCRQVILEVEDRYKKPIRIILYGQNGIYIINSIKDLLPLSFVDANMKGK